MAEAPRGIQATLFDYFQDTEYFTLQEAEEHVLEHQQRDVNTESIRARIYEGIDKDLFERVGKGLYMVSRDNEDGSQTNCLLINGDGRDLSMIPDNTISSIITDHPYQLTASLKGGNRNFADYELFQYNEDDFKEKHRVLIPGGFLVEFLPEENADNYQYLYRVKEMARKVGMEYYAKVGWQKGDFVANTGRKSKNIEDVCFFTKGKARNLRPDAKKDKAEPGVEHYMSGAHGMLPSQFIVSPPSQKDRIHQAEKPVELLEQIINFVTLKNETVLDQFAGSGVLGEAALKTGRNSILIEKDEETFQRLSRRLETLGWIQSVDSSVEEFLSIGKDALIAKDAYDRTGDSNIVMQFVETHDINSRELVDAQVSLSATIHSEETIQTMETAVDAIRYLDGEAEMMRQNISKQDHQPDESREDLKVLECSSRGDRRFSALFAKVTIKGKEKSIEEWYQDAKRTPEGKRAGKGKPFAYIIDPFTGDKLPARDAPDLYRGLWITYLSKNPDLVDYAAQFDAFSDCFQKQRQELTFEETRADFRPDITLSPADIVGAYAKGDKERYVAGVKTSHWYQNLGGKKHKPLDKQVLAAEGRRPEQMQQTSLFPTAHSFSHGH